MLKAIKAGLVAFRASLENPKTSLSDPDDWFYDAVGAAPSDSGVRVSRQGALTYSPVWRAVNLISRDVAKLPLLTYRREGEGKQRAVEHPAFRLLRSKPNREMTSFVFRQTLQSHVLLQGNGYAYIFRRGDASPEELIPLNPDDTYPVRANSVLMYVTAVDGQQRKLLPENVLHVKGLGFDGLCGYSVVQKARDSFGRGMAAAAFGSRYFSNSARPGVILEHPKTLTTEASKRLTASWNDMHQGLENSHKAAILEEGMKATPFGHNARDAQLLEIRQFEIREVANWFGVPPHKLGDTTRTGYASLEQENQSYLDDALDPWLVAWEEECREKLLTEQQKASDTHVIEFMRQALLRADMKTRAEFYTKATGGHPWMTVNEVRGRENMNPADGFDDIKPPVNNFGEGKGKKGGADDEEGDDEEAGGSPAGSDKNPRSGPPSPAAAAAVREVLTDACRRMVKRLALHTRKAAKPGEFADWIRKGRLFEEHRDVVVDALSPAVAACAAVAGSKADAESVADGLIERVMTEARAARDAAETVKDLDARLAKLEGELPGQIAEQFGAKPDEA